MSDDDHPADLMILEKARNKVAGAIQNGSTKSENPLLKEPTTKRKGLKRKQSFQDLATNISQEGSVFDLWQSASFLQFVLH